MAPPQGLKRGEEAISYDVYLRHENGETCEVPRVEEGGTFVFGGSTEAELNVTYNYGECYHLVPIRYGVSFSIKFLDGMQAKNVIPILEHVVEVLGDKPYPDYWAPTPGNAGHAAAILLKWARLHPDATFEVS